jgi:hypothetical protein
MQKYRSSEYVREEFEKSREVPRSPAESAHHAVFDRSRRTLTKTHDLRKKNPLQPNGVFVRGGNRGIFPLRLFSYSFAEVVILNWISFAKYSWYKDIQIYKVIDLFAATKKKSINLILYLFYDSIFWIITKHV